MNRYPQGWLVGHVEKIPAAGGEHAIIRQRRVETAITVIIITALAQRNRFSARFSPMSQVSQLSQGLLLACKERASVQVPKPSDVSLRLGFRTHSVPLGSCTSNMCLVAKSILAAASRRPLSRSRAGP